MKIRPVVLLIILAFALVAFRPLQQDVPPRPTIRLDAGDVIATENVYSYCWPISQGNNQCGFADDLGFTTPQNPLQLDAGQQLNVIIDNSPGDPTFLTVTIDPDGNNVQTVTLESAPLAIFDQALPAGPHILQVDAVYADIAGVQAYISHRFAVNVRGGVAIPQASPTSEAIEPTTEPEATTEVEATDDQPAATEDVGVDATVEAGATEEVPVATEEPGTAPLTTEEPAGVESDATAEPATPEQAGTEAATQETLPPAPTDVTASPSPVATEEATTAPVQASPTATTVLPSPTVPAVATTATAGTQPTMPQVAGGATSTTVPLGGVTTNEVATVPTLVPTVPAPTTPTPTATTPIAQPTEPPAIFLVFAGVTYNPAGVNFCQISATGEQVCVDRPLEAAGQSITLLRDYAIQVHLLGDARPETIDFTFVDPTTLADVQTTTRRGDRLVLFNIDVATGTYFLRVRVDWGATEANYFFRVRVQ